MNTIEKFSYLLNLFVEDNSSYSQRSEFYNMLLTGNYDSEIETHFKTTIEGKCLDTMPDLPSDKVQEMLKRVLKTVNSQKSL